MLLVEIGADMTVFGSAGRLASRVEICPGNNESAGKRKSGRIREGGTRSRSWRWRTRWLRTVYAMLANGTHYQDRIVDCEALSVAKNAPRWIKMLRKHGFVAETVAT